MSAPFKDDHGRSVGYMRISVTDRCNLQCRYCVGRDMHFISHPNIMRYEEILELMTLGVERGVRKIRFTGGEPFVRKGFAEFMVTAAERFPDAELCVTTNATLIKPYLPMLHAGGIRRINISLDTMQSQKYAEITGRDMFDRVLEAIRASVEMGFTVKMNAVAMKGVNDDELPAFLAFAKEQAIDVRFIEFMPIGAGSRCNDDTVWLASDLLKEAAGIVSLTPVEKREKNAGPATVYDIDGGPGRLGVITPWSNHYCATCNRLRLTSDGNLRTCLFSDKVYRLLPVLRHKKLGIEFVDRIMVKASKTKPLGRDILDRMPKGGSVCGTRMASIGG